MKRKKEYDFTGWCCFYTMAVFAVGAFTVKTIFFKYLVGSVGFFFYNAIYRAVCNKAFGECRCNDCGHSGQYFGAVPKLSPIFAYLYIEECQLYIVLHRLRMLRHY